MTLKDRSPYFPSFYEEMLKSQNILIENICIQIFSIYFAGKYLANYIFCDYEK